MKFIVAYATFILAIAVSLLVQLSLDERADRQAELARQDAAALEARIHQEVVESGILSPSFQFVTDPEHPAPVPSCEEVADRVAQIKRDWTPRRAP